MPAAARGARRRGLGRYVPVVAAEWDLEVGDARWREVDGTLCFVDISGFTNLAERLARFGRVGAEELTEVLDRVFSEMLGLAFERGGALLKFGGDALLLLFRGDEHATQACAAAVELRAALRDASRIPTSVGPLRLRMSTGVHTGPVHLFRVGASHRELLVTGPVASTTTDMEKVAEAGDIVVSAATRAALGQAAAPNGKGDGWLLRWRRAPVDRPGPVMRGPVDDEALGACLPVALRRHLRHGDADPEHRVATVGFIKFKGVDGLLAGAGPEAVADALEELVTTVQAAVDEEDVTFLATDIDHDGGKIILAAGVPTTHEDDEGRVLRAARRVADTPTQLDVRIGVNRGHVFAGEVGTAFRCTYTVMGDTVNLAARLMAAAPSRSIYAAPAVLEGSRTLFAATSLPPLAVKGKAEPVSAYAVGPEIGTRAADVGSSLPFVGRERELAAMSAAVAGAGGVRLVGEAGIGKSRLVSEALERVESLRGGPHLSIRAEPYGATTPYRPFRDALRVLIGVVPGDADDVAAQLRTALERLDPSLVPFAPLLATALGVVVPSTPEVDAIEPRFRPERLADVVVSVLDGLLPHPGVVVVENAHWLDDASSQLVVRLVREAATRAWTVIVVGRGDGSWRRRVGQLPVVEVGPLDDAAAEALVIAATAGAPLRPHEVAAIVRRAEGNPLFLREIFGVLRERGVDELPDSLEGMVGSEIDSLEPSARRVLRYAAVLGHSFREAVLDALLVGDELVLDDATRRATAHFLQADGDGQLRFRHALHRDVAYAGLPYRRRRNLHLRAAQVTEWLAGDDQDAVADVLALHYALAQEAAPAWRWGRLAGDRARDAYANVEAAAHYERALDAARQLNDLDDEDRARVWTALGDVRIQAGLFDAAFDAYRRASRHVGSDPIARADIALKRARARERGGACTSALREIAAGRRVLDGVDTAEARAATARLLAFAALVRQAQERPSEAFALAERAAAVAREADEREALARAYCIADWADLMLGRGERAVRAWDALPIYEELGDVEGAASALNNFGGIAYFDGRWDDALDLYESALAGFRRAGNAVQAAVSAANIGEVRLNRGDAAGAEPLLRDAARVLRASQFATVTFVEIQLARAVAALGDDGEALTLLRGAVDESTRAGEHLTALDASIHLAELLARGGAGTDALALLDAAGRSAGDAVALYGAAIGRSRVHVLLALGRVGDADAELTAAIEAAARDGAPPYELALLLATDVEVAAAARREPDPRRATEADALLRRLGVEHPAGAGLVEATRA